MVLVSAAMVRMFVTALLVASPDDVTSALAIADFLTSIGGDTAMKTSRSMPSDPVPQIYPLVRDESEIIGYRFFAEKPTANGFVTAERVSGVCARKCAVKGGRIEPDDGEVARSFHNRPLPPRGNFKSFWSGVSAVCVRSPSEVMGGFVAITLNNTELVTKGDIGARLFSPISLMPTRTPPSIPIHQTAFGRPRRSKRSRPPGVPIMSLSSGLKKRSAATLPSAWKPTVAP